VIAVVGANGADLMEKPTGAVKSKLATGTAVTVQGRSADSAWIYVQMTDKSQGWLAANQVVVFNLRSLPVMDGNGTAAAVAPESTMSTTTAMTATEPLSTTAALSSSAAMTVAVAATPTITSAPAASAPVGGSGPRPIPADDGQPRATIVITEGRVNIRSGPTVAYRVLAKGRPGEVFIALARNGPADWIKVKLAEAPDGFGWINANYVQVNVPIVDLPISTDVSSAPTPTPTAEASTAAPSSPATQSQAVAQRTAPTGLRGKMVIQTGWGGTFYLYNLASGALQALGGGFDPAISPDGSAIAYTREDNETGVYIINSDGSNDRQIFGERQTLRSPKWSPDGKWLVFSRADGTYKCRDLGFFGLCPSDSQLASQAPHIHLKPNQLPPNCDANCQKAIEEGIRKEIGGKIVSQFDPVSKPNWTIARIGVNGEDYRDLPVLNSALAPDWNAAGIVYQSAGGLQKVTDTADAQSQRVIFDSYLFDPDWQPGGGRIVFQSKQGSHWEIFTVNPDGSGLTALTHPETTLVDELPSNVSPAWSPDGQAIVYLSNRDENNNAGRWRVWVMNADGSNQHPLPVDLPITYNFAGEQMVDWGQ
jgi:hypothetical protein